MPRLSQEQLQEKREAARTQVQPRQRCVQGEDHGPHGHLRDCAGARAVLAAVREELEKIRIRRYRSHRRAAAPVCAHASRWSAVETVGRCSPVKYGDLTPEKVRQVLAEAHCGWNSGHGVRRSHSGSESFSINRCSSSCEQRESSIRRRSGITWRETAIALEKALTSLTPEAGDRRDHALGPAGPRRRGISHRHQVEDVPGREEDSEVHHRELRRRRPRRLHGPEPAGIRSPFLVEGMTIAAYAIGASRGYVYVRSEYPLAIQRLQRAIARLASYGLLGEKILHSGFDFDVEIREGSGAFVCGEETSLIHSIEGESPEPRQRPPFPAQVGLWGCPTVINNVETLANVPVIINRGAEWYAASEPPAARAPRSSPWWGRSITPA